MGGKKHLNRYFCRSYKLSLKFQVYILLLKTRINQILKFGNDVAILMLSRNILLNVLFVNYYSKGAHISYILFAFSI